MAAFPLAYGIVMSALYAPLIAMLLALVFRGVSFEFRWRDPAHRPLWDFMFTAGSFTAALAQGITLGALLQGIQVEGRAYAGSTGRPTAIPRSMRDGSCESGRRSRSRASWR
jgi:cytochrome d ubiquinol oxidase subunit II